MCFHPALQGGIVLTPNSRCLSPVFVSKPKRLLSFLACRSMARREVLWSFTLPAFLGRFLLSRRAFLSLDSALHLWSRCAALPVCFCQCSGRRLATGGGDSVKGEAPKLVVSERNGASQITTNFGVPLIEYPPVATFRQNTDKKGRRGSCPQQRGDQR